MCSVPARSRRSVLLRLTWFLLCLLTIASAHTAPLATAYPAPPQVLFKDLFVAVQLAAIYPDGKTFADAVSHTAPDDVLAQYHAAHPDSAQVLKGFTDAHFTLPAAVVSTTAPATVAVQPLDIVTHIDQLWDVLTRTTTTAPPYASLLPLPQPYVVPGRPLSRDLLLGFVLHHAGPGRERAPGPARPTWSSDFAYLIDTYGHVPNGARTYYLSRSQPPFFLRDGRSALEGGSRRCVRAAICHS
jgi:alpha,alpha-trehalase